MSLINQQGMYMGATPLNPQPYVNVVLQARQRKQAREDAMDKYYQKLPDTINDKNVRDIEIPIINDYKQKIFEYGVKNKESLRNPKADNGAAQLGLDKLMREAASVARLSQNAAKLDLQAGKFFLNKDNQYALNNDEYLADNDLHNLPVTDPRHKALDLEKYAANRPFNEVGFVKDIKTKFPYSEKVVRQPDPTDPNYEMVTTLPVLDEKTKIQMVSDAADRFHNDPTFRKKIKNDLAGTGQINDLLGIAKEVFGVEPDEMDDEMLAAAYTYSKLPIGKTKEKVQGNYTNRQEGKNKEWGRRNKITYGQSLAKIRLNNENRKAGQPTDDTGYLSDEVAAEFGVPEKVTLGGKERDVTVVYTDKVDPARLNIITGTDLSKKQFGVKPIPIKQLDGSYKNGYYVDPGTGDWEGLNGQRISRERVKDDYIKTVAPTKQKLATGTKASENTKDKKPVKTTASGLPVFK